MSVIVKGMKMPECCDVCDFVFWSNIDQMAYCKRVNYMPCHDSKTKRANFCPLVALPDHHGRLIDENEVRTVMNWLLTQPQRPTWNDTYHAIQEMNAVIEAEDSE